MSNLSDSNELNNNGSEPSSNLQKEATTAGSKLNRWSFIQSDLSKALDTWQELEKNASSLSPEEEQFVKIKTIIGQLKDKLEHF